MVYILHVKNMSWENTHGSSVLKNFSHHTKDDTINTPQMCPTCPSMSNIDVFGDYGISIPNEILKLKRIAQRETKNKVNTVNNFCNNWKKSKQSKHSLFFDFHHKFLYCAVNKVKI